MGYYHITDPAAADLSELWDGYVERGGSETTANGLIDELLTTLQNLADFPDIGTSRYYLKAHELAFPHKQHIIVYEKASNEHINILRIVYGGRDLAALFADDED